MLEARRMDRDPETRRLRRAFMRGFEREIGVRESEVRVLVSLWVTRSLTPHRRTRAASRTMQKRKRRRKKSRQKMKSGRRKKRTAMRMRPRRTAMTGERRRMNSSLVVVVSLPSQWRLP